MNKLSLTVGALALGLASAGALADGKVTVSDATGAYNGTDGAGGAFTLTAATPGGNGNFNGVYGDNRRLGDGRSANSILSFCLERSENIGFGTTYFTQISKSANRGGTPNSVDPISGKTCAIYREFRRIVSNAAASNVNTTGSFGGLFGATLSSAETTAIQYAIWAEEGERALGTSAEDVIAAGILSWAAANDCGLQGVRVLRLWTNWSATGGYSGYAQDQLTIVPLPPAGWAGLGSLAGVATVGYIRRRKLAAN